MLLRLESSAANSRALSSSDVSILNAVDGEPNLPAAFILGAILNAIVVELILSRFAPHSSTSPKSPIFSVFLKSPMPLETMVLFSPRSGTMSATVPIAVMSPYCSETMSKLPSSKAASSLSATPTPARSLNFDLSSCLCGSTTAQAFGSLSDGW